MDRAHAIDGVLAAGIAALCGGAAAVHPVPALVFLAGSAWLLRRRMSWPLLVVAIALCAATWVRARTGMEASARAYRTAAATVSPPRRCDVLVEVTRSPVVVTPRLAVQRVAGGGGRARFDGVVLSGACGEEDERLPRGMTLRLYGAPEDLGRGSRLRAIVSLGAVRRFDNPGAMHPDVALALRGFAVSGGILDSEVERAGRGLRAAIDRARNHVRRRIERTFAPAVTPHARALVLGEYDLDHREREVFAASGLAHLLAVSGTHLVLAVLALGRLLRALLARVERLARRFDVGRISAAVCIVASWLYADFAGGGGSANRAAAMLSVMLAARVLGRRPAGGRALGWSLLGAALAQPLATHDLSFGLSVLATAGIMAWGGLGLDDVSASWHRWLRVTAQATAAAHGACLPLLLSLSSDVPPLTVAANILAAPVGELAALPACLAHGALWWAGPLERGAATVGSGALAVVRAVAHATADASLVLQLPPPTPWQLAALALGGVGLWCARRYRRRWGVATCVALVLLEAVAMRSGAPKGQLRITALDVGQGDAILTDLPDGRVMLIDGGGLVGSPIDTGERVVLEVLRHRRRKRIDVVVLSHPHPDHYGGLLRILQSVPVGEIWMSGLGMATHPDGELSQAVASAAARGAQIRLARELCGRPRRFGQARVDVLGPCPSFDRAASANDNSLVLRIALGHRAALLTGDAEAHQEAQLLASRGALLRADLLKVGHHGSRTSTSAAWVAAVRPEVAVVSCGVRNRFGHPHPQTLHTLARVPLLRTDRIGAAVWTTDGERHEWRPHRSFGILSVE